MELIFTDGKDERFVHLCDELDAYLNELAGGASQRSQYNQYNMLGDIHDVVLAVEEGEAVACGSFKAYSPGIAEIKRVFTRAAYRKRGFSKAILKALEDKATADGYQKLILETGISMKEATSMYLAYGFEVTPNYPPYTGMPRSVCMEKLLPAEPHI